MKLESLRAFGKTPLLSEAARLKGSFAKNLLTLSKKYPRAVAADALELITLQKTKKFSRAKKMWFDREGLEMATPEAVANYRAKRMNGKIVELCSGIGGDSIALSRAGDLTSFDLSPERIEMTKHNVEVYEGKVNAQIADIEKLDLKSLDADWFFFDPQRRGAKSPDFETMFERIRETGADYAIKLSPLYSAKKVEWISLAGELREACLWSNGRKKITVLPSGESILVSGAKAPQVTDIGAYILEPDPSVIVSKAFGDLSHKYPCTRIDERVAYLTSSKTYKTEFFPSQLKVLEVTSGDLSRVRSALRHHGLGKIDIKCRGFPVSPEKLRKTLSSKGENGTVIFTRSRDRRVAIIAKRQTF